MIMSLLLFNGARYQCRNINFELNLLVEVGLIIGIKNCSSKKIYIIECRISV